MTPEATQDNTLDDFSEAFTQAREAKDYDLMEKVMNRMRSLGYEEQADYLESTLSHVEKEKTGVIDPTDYHE